MDSFLILMAGFAVWSFAIWGAVLFVKKLVEASQNGLASKAWKRFSPLFAPILGLATGFFVPSLLLAVAEISTSGWPESVQALVPYAGAFLGFGAGSVASTAHNAVLWKVEDFIRK